MKNMKNFFNKFLKDERGQGMVEYALIIGLVAVLLIGGLTALKGGIGETFGKITTELNNSVDESNTTTTDTTTTP